jgi:hypothetical protein
MLPHVAKLVYDDQRLILGSFWTLGECAQAPFSCILVLGGFCFSDTPDLVMSSSLPLCKIYFTIYQKMIYLIN